MGRKSDYKEEIKKVFKNKADNKPTEVFVTMVKVNSELFFEKEKSSVGRENQSITNKE